MKGPEKEAREWTACGYGLLGLCCSACLSGPCRISPFGEDPAESPCGDDRDRMVAKHLLRLSASESGHAMKLLADAISKVSSLGLTSPLVEASKDLLSPFPAGTGVLTSPQYPEAVFPSIRPILRGAGSGSISLAGLLLDSFAMGQSESAVLDEVLDLCLQNSLLSLVVEECCRDLNLLVGEEQTSAGNRELSEVLDRLPSKPCPMVIQFTDSSASSPRVEDLLNGLEKRVTVLPIEERSLLPEIGRGLYRKWNLPATHLRAAVLISSNRATSTLGALALGFNTAAFPSLPIHGSSRVKEFFVNEFRRRFGNGLLPSWQEGFDSFLAGFLGGTG